MSGAPQPVHAAPPGENLSRYLHLSLGGLAALAMFVLVLITFVDVGARYLFNSPIPGAYELTELIMGVMIFSALPVVTWDGKHITIDLLDHVTPRWIAGWRDLFIAFVSAAVLGGLGSELWSLGEVLSSFGDVTEYLRIPIHPIIFTLSILTWLTCGLAILKAALTLRRMVRPATQGTA